MFKRLMLVLIAGAAIMAAASCGSGGGNVTGNNPLNPTTAPSGILASASPVPTGVGSTAPTVTPTSGGSVTPSPTPTPTTQSTASTNPMQSASPAPTPTSTSSSSSTLATTCATATGPPSSTVYTLPGNEETIQLPNYPASPPYQITGSSDVPSQSPSNTQLTIELSQNTFVPSGQSSSNFQEDSGYPTVDFYTTLEENTSTTFGNGSTSLLIPVTIVSPCVVSGRTYGVDEVSGGLSVYTETDMATSAGSVTGHIKVALNPFPASTEVYITVSH